MTAPDREGTIREMLPLVRKIARARAPHRSRQRDGRPRRRRLCWTDSGSRFVRTVRGACVWISTRLASSRGAMLNGLRRLDPVSERVRRELRHAEKERYALAATTGALPTQIQMERRRPALRRATLHAHRYTPLSLDSQLPIGERLRNDWSADPAAITGERDERAAVRAALGRLPSRQRRVLALHYFGGQSLHQIGSKLQISPQRASQLHLAALKNLRKVMHGPY